VVVVHIIDGVVCFSVVIANFKHVLALPAFHNGITLFSFIIDKVFVMKVLKDGMFGV
jgi:hypothetical protein